MTDDRVEQVLEAARRLVAAFARNDAEAYFAAFSEDASFIFHNWPQPLRSRAAYRELWERWRREDGFEVLACESSNTCVSLKGDLAIFSHDVATRLRPGNGKPEPGTGNHPVPPRTTRRPLAGLP